MLIVVENIREHLALQQLKLESLGLDTMSSSKVSFCRR
jgi:hypothetical protein